MILWGYLNIFITEYSRNMSDSNVPCFLQTKGNSDYSLCNSITSSFNIAHLQPTYNTLPDPYRYRDPWQCRDALDDIPWRGRSLRWSYITLRHSRSALRIAGEVYDLCKMCNWLYKWKSTNQRKYNSWFLRIISILWIIVCYFLNR